MKTIKGVDEKPEHFQEDVPAEVIATIPTYRRMFKAAVGMGLSKGGENAIDLVQLGLKLRIEGDITLEDAEFKLLKERCSENPAQWQAHFHGLVMLKLKEAENAKHSEIPAGNKAETNPPA